MIFSFTFFLSLDFVVSHLCNFTKQIINYDMVLYEIKELEMDT